SDHCLALAAALESRSEHPIARAFGLSQQPAEQVTSQPGQGLEGWVDGQRLRIGNPAWACGLATVPPPRAPDAQGQWLLLADHQRPLAWFGLDDRLRNDAPQLLAACRAQGWQTLLLSGDSSPMVQQVASQLAIDQAQGSLAPEAKLAELQRLRREGRTVLVVGDGVNDVPLLAAADISVAMGSATDLAKTHADAVLLNNHLGTLVQAMALARRTRRIIIQNLAWAAVYNGLMLPFAAAGWVTPVWAAVGMSISSLTVVLNALRLARTPAPPRPAPATVAPAEPEPACPRSIS
ncbi:HAD-IC family P-type ATPase, partial [Pseudomonas sp.]|uniref:heavy metal translocating P-type ATPase n=1 Tax=Pseudomonas sp. TaxID=306 RepID=UPI00258B664D